MKKLWMEPEVTALNLNRTTRDVTPGDQQDDLSWQNGFESYICHCS